ncbi:hypothetical protein RESH_03195 [Rhodopirellula europaea SH398]|uniref:Uncharacterized protein n=1 Tax=Rhodopirellula europaea SH398 TaxID=1263868 RepID=M5SIX8_9BACT|nr:hypothetical protein RESH_03195 [Rhodopirellula europaea SH398]
MGFQARRVTTGCSTQPERDRIRFVSVTEDDRPSADRSNCEPY